MNNNEMYLVKYIEYIKTNLNRIEDVLNSKEIDAEYLKKIVKLMNNIDNNIYEIYVLIESYYGWEDFI